VTIPCGFHKLTSALHFYRDGASVPAVDTCPDRPVRYIAVALPTGLGTTYGRVCEDHEQQLRAEWVVVSAAPVPEERV
jgi:hypothetical protein